MAGSAPAFKSDRDNDSRYFRQASTVFRAGGGLKSQATTAFRLW
jgi:hypothetical protein